MKLQLSVENKKVILPTNAALAQLSSTVQLYHGLHNLRHPLGVYNVSISKCVDTFSKVMTMLSNPEFMEKCFAGKGRDPWHADLLSAYDGLLDALMEHMDDCLNVLLCFFPDKKSRKNHAAITTYEKDIGKFRDHIGRVVNHIKHGQGRLRFVGMRNASHLVAGYFVEGIDENGVAGPQKTVHTGNNNAFSFHRDVRFHLSQLLFVSAFLGKAISALASPNTSQKIEGYEELYKLIAQVEKLPKHVFPKEQNLDWPRISLIPPIVSGIEQVSVEFPSYAQRPSILKGKCDIFSTFQGDGVTKSFRLPI